MSYLITLVFLDHKGYLYLRCDSAVDWLKLRLKENAHCYQFHLNQRIMQISTIVDNHIWLKWSVFFNYLYNLIRSFSDQYKINNLAPREPLQ